MPGTFNYNAPANTFDYEGFATVTGGTNAGTRSATGATGNSGDTNVLSATTWTTIQSRINTGTSWKDLPTTIGLDKNVLRTAHILGYLKKYRSYDVEGAPVKRHRGRSGG